MQCRAVVHRIGYKILQHKNNTDNTFFLNPNNDFPTINNMNNGKTHRSQCQFVYWLSHHFGPAEWIAIKYGTNIYSVQIINLVTS